MSSSWGTPSFRANFKASSALKISPFGAVVVAWSGRPVGLAANVDPFANRSMTTRILILLAALTAGCATANESPTAESGHDDAPRQVLAGAVANPEIAQLKSMVKELTGRLERLEAKPKATAASAPTEKPGDAELRSIINNLMQDNEAFVKSKGKSYFEPFSESQTPRATVVTCADSRVHSHAIDKTPDGDLFMVRNIGNQLATAEGSVEYGVHHLHTPLLVFVGHTACGAIKAAQGDYSALSPTIKRELDTIRVAKSSDVMKGVQTNVNNQVAAAMKKFAHEIAEGKLTVIGAVYDFRNELKQGYGRLVVTNVQGEVGLEKVAKWMSLRAKLAQRE